MQKDVKVDTIVHGGLVVTSTSAIEAAVAIKGERIVAVGDPDTLPPADRYIEATGKYILPGAIDCHVHFGQVDDWSVGPQAAAHAGLTTIMPFHVFDPVEGKTLTQVVHEVKEEGRAKSVVDFALHLVLTNRPEALNDLPEAFGLGVTSFKMFMTYKKRVNRMCSDAHILKAMEMITAHSGLLQVHAENGELIDYLEDKAIAEGRVRPTDYPATAPPIAEAEAINRAIVLAEIANCPLYIVHLSTKAGLEHIKQAQNQGQRVWTETCPQYLLLTEEEMERLGPFAKIGPPLRSADMVNQNALWEGSAQGHISTIGSDHSVHPREAKERGWDNVFIAPDGRSIPFGAPSMETLVPLMYDEGVVKRGLPIWWMARVLAENPARLFGIYPRKGVIQPGSDADLLIWDPKPERTIHAADLHSRAGVTLYEGWKVHGNPWMTLLRGKVLLNNGKLEQQPGYGRFLTAGGPLPPLAGPVR